MEQLVLCAAAAEPTCTTRPRRPGEGAQQPEEPARGSPQPLQPEKSPRSGADPAQTKISK